MYAARLATALKQRVDVELFGMGGPQMRAAGVEIITDYSEVAVVGITEIVKHLPSLLQAMERLVDAAEKRRPALAILTDFPGFHLRLARKLKPKGIQNVYYICPQFWAWRPWRANLVRRRFAKALCIFPFEEKFFCDAGVPTKFIGHPLVGAVEATKDRREFCQQHGLDASRAIVTILPGSRTGELNHHLPVLLEACAQINGKVPAQFVVAAARAQDVAQLKVGWTTGLTVRVVEGETYNALAAANAAIVSSGTATVETALSERTDGGDLSRVATDSDTGQTSGEDALLCNGEPDRGKARSTRTRAGRLHARASCRGDAESAAGAQCTRGAAAGAGRGPEAAGTAGGGGASGGGDCRYAEECGWQRFLEGCYPI